MKVTPTKKKFGKYAPGDVFELPDKMAKVFIKVGKLKQPDETKAAPTYQTRMMQPEPVVAPAAAAAVQYTRSEPVEAAPYGYKDDGTPRKRPGRAAASE